MSLHTYFLLQTCYVAVRGWINMGDVILRGCKTTDFFLDKCENASKSVLVANGTSLGF